MTLRLKEYLRKFPPAKVDEIMLDTLRQAMKEAVVEIAENIRQREKRAAELRVTVPRRGMLL